MTVLDQLRAALARTERTAEGLRQAIAPLEALEAEASMPEVLNGRGLIEAPNAREKASPDGGAEKHPRGIRANRRPPVEGARDRGGRAAEARDAGPVVAGKGRAAGPPAHGEKVCRTCKKSKPVAAFAQSASGSLFSSCRDCHGNLIRQRLAAKREAGPRKRGQGKASKSEDAEPVRAERRDLIKARAAAGAGERDRTMHRCKLPLASSPEQAAVKGRAPCGALVEAWKIGAHTLEVHDTILRHEDVPKWFEPATPRRADDEDEAA